jgi:hypothetical protein
MLQFAHSSPHFSLPIGSNSLISPTPLFKTELQCPEWRHFVRIIVLGSIQDIGVLVCLGILQIMWNVEPYRRAEEAHLEITVAERIYWTRELMMPVFPEKVWISSPEEMDICLYLLYRAILGPLVVISPCNPDRSERDREKILSCIVEMLRFDERIVESEMEYGNLCDCTVKWGVGDVWRKAMEMVRFEIADESASAVGVGKQDASWERLFEEAAREK